MILVARTRGNGGHLSRYLMDSPANDNAEVFDIRGTIHKDNVYLALREFSVKGQLTKSKKEIFHVVLNPPQDATMSAEDWLKCTGIIEKHLPFFANQPRVMVLHEKGHVHMHVAYSRVDATGKIIPDKFFKLALSKARREIEEVLEQQRTPFRNRDRDQIKKTLTELWQQTATGKAFINAAKLHGYTIVRSESRRPFMVVDANGRSFDLIRQLKHVRTKDVRERLQGCTLGLDKEAIREARIRQDPDYFDRLQENCLTAILEQKKKYDERQEELKTFKEKMRLKKIATQEMLSDQREDPMHQRAKELQQAFNQQKGKITTKEKPLTQKPNGKLEKALRELEKAMIEADERKKAKQLRLDL